MRRCVRLCYLPVEFIRELWRAGIRSSDSEIASWLRQRMYRTSCMIDTNVVVTNSENFKSGDRSSLYHSCYILNTHGKFALGNDSHLGAFCYVNVRHGNISIGDDVAIGPGTKIIAYTNHYQYGKKVTEVRVTKDITIMNNVFIGANCTVLPGTSIKSNVVVGAGSIVKGELEENSIYAGAPCRKIKALPGY